MLASGAQTQLICYTVHTLWYSVRDNKEDMYCTTYLWYSVRDNKEDKVPKYTVPQALHCNFDYLRSHRSVTHTLAVDSDT